MHERFFQTPPQPAAGAEISQIPSANNFYKLLALRAKLVTSAAVANRYPHLQLSDANGNVYWESSAGTAQTAGVTTYYSWVADSGSLNQGTTLVDDLVSLSLPSFWVPADWKFATKTTAIDTGDQWSSVALIFVAGNEWEHLQRLEAIEAAIRDLP